MWAHFKFLKCSFLLWDHKIESLNISNPMISEADVIICLKRYITETEWSFRNCSWETIYLSVFFLEFFFGLPQYIQTASSLLFQKINY